MKSRRVAIALLSLVAVAIMFWGITKTLNSEQRCQSPYFIGGYRQNNEPDKIIDDIVSDLGGLPKTDTDIYEALKMSESNISIAVYPVQEWRVEKSWVTANPQVHSIFDDDPIFGIHLDIHVSYADGEQAKYHFTSWRYGMVLCPVIISLGDGPPGNLERIQ